MGGGCPGAGLRHAAGTRSSGAAFPNSTNKKRRTQMKQWKNVDEVLDFAIKNEENARDFYKDLAARMERQAMKDVFEGFAKEEEGHKQLLLKVKKTGGFAPSSEKILDLKMADYLVPVEPEGDLSYQDALILAMKKEKIAYKLYTNLAARDWLPAPAPTSVTALPDWLPLEVWWISTNAHFICAA
jgi:rubrerythrin